MHTRGAIIQMEEKIYAKNLVEYQVHENHFKLMNGELV
jgi:hypothetical protein